MKRKVQNSFYLICFIFLITAISYSYPNNYQQLIVGSRIAGMGGAGTAIGGEGESAYYNPAGIVFTKRDGISLSVSNYGLFFMKEKNRQDAGDTINTSLKHTSGLIVVPSATAYSFILDKKSPTPKYFFTLALFVPSKTDLDTESQGSDGSYINYVKSWEIDYIYHFYIDFAVKVTHFFSVGFAVVGSYAKLYRNDVFYRYDISTPANSTTNIQSSNFKNIGLGFTLGILFTFKRFNFGFVLKSKKLRIYSESNYSLIVPGDPPILYNDLKVNYQMPWELSWGITFAIIPDHLFFAFDFRYYPSESQNVVSSSQYKVNFDRLSNWNLNIGLELVVNKSLSFRTGFYTDRSATPNLVSETDSNLLLTRVNRYGITLGVGFNTEHTKTNISVVYVFGSGHRKIQNIISSGDYGITRVKISEFILTIGSSYWFDNPKKNKKKTNN